MNSRHRIALRSGRRPRLLPNTQPIDVRIGPNSEVRARNWAVRFTLKNRRRQPGLSGPKSANGRHRRLRRPEANAE